MASLMDAGVSAPAGEGLQNLEAEAALLGAVLIENGVLDHLPELRPEHFAEPLHERIFAAITGEIEKGRRATPLTLRPLFESDLAIKELGGAKYLAQLTADGAGLLAPRELSEQIIDLSYRRSMLARLQDAREGLLDPALPLPDLSALADPDCSASRAPRQTLPFEWAGKAQAVLDDLWLINGWLPRNGLGVIYGHPGSGKTFLALHMAQHVATGSAWAGRDVERGLVLYLAAEGQTGFRNRLAAMRQEGHLPADAPFVFVPVPIDLQAEQGEVTRLIATLSMISKQCDLPPALVVIDTLSKTFGAGKENTDDMASYVANCQRIASKFECFTLIVHHRPKGEDAADLRGHSSLKGGIDTAILVESRTLKTAKITKQKDGEDGLSVQFSLDQIELGQDKQGNVITSCVVSIAEDEIEHAARHPLDEKMSRLKGRNRTALQVIQAMIAKHGKPLPIDIPSDAIDRYRSTHGIELGQVADRLENEFLATVDSEPDKKSATARRTASRTREALKAAGILGSWGDWIWIN